MSRIASHCRCKVCNVLDTQSLRNQVIKPRPVNSPLSIRENRNILLFTKLARLNYCAEGKMLLFGLGIRRDSRRTCVAFHTSKACRLFSKRTGTHLSRHERPPFDMSLSTSCFRYCRLAKEIGICSCRKSLAFPVLIV